MGYFNFKEEMGGTMKKILSIGLIMITVVFLSACKEEEVFVEVYDPSTVDLEAVFNTDYREFYGERTYYSYSEERDSVINVIMEDFYTIYYKISVFDVDYEGYAKQYTQHVVEIAEKLDDGVHEKSWGVSSRIPFSYLYKTYLFYEYYMDKENYTIEGDYFLLNSTMHDEVSYKLRVNSRNEIDQFIVLHNGIVNIKIDYRIDNDIVLTMPETEEYTYVEYLLDTKDLKGVELSMDGEQPAFTYNDFTGYVDVEDELIYFENDSVLLTIEESLILIYNKTSEIETEFIYYYSSERENILDEHGINEAYDAIDSFMKSYRNFLSIDLDE